MGPNGLVILSHDTRYCVATSETASSRFVNRRGGTLAEVS